MADHPDHVKTPETIEMVTNLARSLVGIREIAALVGVGVSTIQRHYHAEYTLGRSQTLSSASAKYVKLALNGERPAGDPDALKFVLARNLWNAQRLEHTGKDGGPIEFIDLSRLTAEELELYGRLSAKAEGLDPDGIIITPIPDRR